jgi:hypothetical protein
MVDLVDEARFLLEPLDRRRIAAERRRQNLDRRALAGRAVHRAIDDAHSASAKRGVDHIPTDVRAICKRGIV